MFHRDLKKYALRPVFGSGVLSILTLAIAVPAAAEPALEEIDPETGEETVFDDNWLSIGIGAAVLPSYEGSDDFKFSPLPLAQGKLGPVRINPRPAGIAFDFLPKSDEGVQFSAGMSVRYRANRSGDVKDEIVALAQPVDEALEIGPSVGISIPEVLHSEDSITINLDARWDVLGAHEGFVFEPGVTYFTPLSRGTVVSFSLGSQINDSNFADYYFTVDAADAAATGLPQFEASGGVKNINSALFIAFDLDGNIANGGPAIFAAGGYTRLFGDHADSPFTSERGSANQFVGALGVGYTF